MAYVSFAPDDSAGTALHAPRSFEAVASEAAPSFSALEWSVIGLARNDSLTTLRTPGRFDRIAGVLFGGRYDPRLSDPRLEALRRVAVTAWHRGYDVPTREEQAFRTAGFTADQFRLVVTSITHTRQTSRDLANKQRGQTHRDQTQNGTLA